MDIWLNINTRSRSRDQEKSLTLVVTPFKEIVITKLNCIYQQTSQEIFLWISHMKCLQSSSCIGNDTNTTSNNVYPLKLADFALSMIVISITVGVYYEEDGYNKFLQKSCATRDSLYQQCRFSTKCVRRELFCDGRINCAWPYVEPAGNKQKIFQIYYFLLLLPAKFCFK